MKIELVPLNSLFSIEPGNQFDLRKMSQCAPGDQAIAFIGRSGERNGLVAFVEKLDAVEPYERGLITVALDGSALSPFVQPRPFYTAKNIGVVRPLTKMSLETKLYYCLCLEASRLPGSNNGRGANKTLQTIQLPAPRRIPSWVSGKAGSAAEEFCHELLGSLTR